METSQALSAQRPDAGLSGLAGEGELATEFAWRVLEEIDYGLMLVSPAGELRHANLLARQELSRERLLRVEHGQVVGNSALQTQEIAHGVSAAGLGRRQMLILRNGDATLPVACVPLFHACDSECSAVLLILARQTGTQNLNLTFFSRFHQLTPAEEDVLRALCEGLKVHEIARANGVAECTVRTQVRSLRDKTGISSIRLLVQKVAALPPLVPMSLTASPRGFASLHR